MGGGIPAAISIALASGKRTILISGDGSFCQCMQELEVIHRLNLNIVIFVIENGGYASTRSSEMRAFGRVSEGRSFPDIQAVVEAFDIPVVFCQDVVDLEPWVIRAIGPKVFVIDAPQEELAFPRVLFDGKGSLSNMAPYNEEK
jgi:acetolactate synthase-1/2/3 large subunit